MPQLPPGISPIDAVIVGVFVFQILWGAKLGFALATFSLASEILGLIIGLLYTSSIAQFLDQNFHLVNQLNAFLAQKTQIPSNLIGSFGQTLFEGIVFLVLFLGIQSIFFYMGKTIHHQVGVRRITYFSNSFFGMFIGVIKAVLEVTFFLIAWNAIAKDPNVQTSLQVIGGFTHITDNSILLPLFQKLVPAASPIAKFF